MSGLIEIGKEGDVGSGPELPGWVGAWPRGILAPCPRLLARRLPVGGQCATSGSVSGEAGLEWPDKLVQASATGAASSSARAEICQREREVMQVRLVDAGEEQALSSLWP
jgi:hypothetical protein